MRDTDSRLIEAIVGVTLAATLLLAAFAVIAQEPADTAPAQGRTPAHLVP
jgi:hypothetical protein